MNPPPSLTPLILVFVATALAQKLANNYEGLSKVLVRDRLSTPTDAGGLGLDPAAAGAFLTAAGLGYALKPLFGPLTDRLPVLGRRRTGWLLVAGAVTAAGWGWVAAGGGATATGLLAGLLVVNLGVTLSDVVCDGLMVEAGQARDKATGGTGGNRPLQTAQWAAGLGGILLGSAAGGVIAARAGLPAVAVASAGLPLLAAGLAWVLVDEPRTAWDRRAARGGLLAGGLAMLAAGLVVALRAVPPDTLLGRAAPLLTPALVLAAVLAVARPPRELVGPALLVALWPAIPLKAESQYFFTYLTADSPAVRAALADSPLVGRLAAPDRLPVAFYGSVYLTVEAVAGLAALAVLYRFGRGVSLRTLLLLGLAGWAGVLLLFAGLAAGGGRHLGYVLACAAAGGFVLWAGTLATLFYAAGRVPATDQATSFALLMGLSNLAGLVGVETVGGYLYAAGPPLVGRSAGGDAGLAAVLLASAAHLVVLAGLVWGLSATGRIDPPAGAPVA